MLMTILSDAEDCERAKDGLWISAIGTMQAVLVPVPNIIEAMVVVGSLYI